MHILDSTFQSLDANTRDTIAGTPDVEIVFIRYPMYMTCPFCKRSVRTEVYRHSTAKTHIAAIILGLIG